MNTKLVTGLKRLVIGFFAIIFVMGFFANSLMTYTLPNVKVQKISSGTEIKATSEVWGTIAAKRSEVIALPQAAIIETLYVKKGSYVRVGDPLFKVKLEPGSAEMTPQLIREKLTLLSETLIQERAQLESKYDTQLKALTTQQTDALAVQSKNKALFEAGALSKEVLEADQKHLADVTAQLADTQKAYDLELSALSLKAKENKVSQQLLEAQLQNNDGGENAYAKLGADRIAVATAEGYMTTVPEAGKRYYPGETLGVLGICKSYQDLCFEITMSQRAFYMASESAAPLSLTSSDGLKIGVVTFDYRHAAFQDGNIIVQGNFTQEPDIWVFPGQEVVSKASYSQYIQDEIMAVPRSAVVTSGNGLEGEGSLIYLIREEEDALGKSTIAVSTPVEVVYLTDDYAIVKDLDYMASDQVILNPNARISDGTKVYICQSSK